MKNLIKDMMKTSIIEHQLNIEVRMRQLPDLIDPKKDIYLWELMSTCNNIILDLVSDEFILYNELKVLVYEWSDILQMIKIVVGDAATYFLINIYFSIIMEYATEYCIDNELFEACSNIKKFENMI
jgi:hypothetical protein